MADIKLIAEHYPAAREVRDSEIIGFRGDVLCYWANLEKPSFSTDAQGFRHTVLSGKKYSLVDCTQSPRYGIVLGPSTLFASGYAGNDKTMASQLSERFGFPFANGSMPGGNSRNLYALLVGVLAAAKQPPAVVVLSNGGDLGNFCDTGFADPIFGSPNHVQIKAIRDTGLTTDLEPAFSKLLVFTRLWTSMTAGLCKARKIPLVFLHQSTFFEKKAPSAAERRFKLGQPGRPGQQQLFENFRTFNARFFVNRQDLAKELGLPIAGVGLTDRLGFVDEFHLDTDSLKLLSDAVGEVIEPLLGRGEPKSAKKVAPAA